MQPWGIWKMLIVYGTKLQKMTLFRYLEKHAISAICDMRFRWLRTGLKQSIEFLPVCVNHLEGSIESSPIERVYRLDKRLSWHFATAQSTLHPWSHTTDFVEQFYCILWGLRRLITNCPLKSTSFDTVSCHVCNSINHPLFCNSSCHSSLGTRHQCDLPSVGMCHCRLSQNLTRKVHLTLKLTICYTRYMNAWRLLI